MKIKVYAPDHDERGVNHGKVYHRLGVQTPDQFFAACSRSLRIVPFPIELEEDNPLICRRQSCQPRKVAAPA